MVQKVGEINLFFTNFVNKTTMDSFGLFHQRFEPLKIHQTISNSNQTIPLYLIKIDKSGPKIRKPYLKVLTTISIGLRFFPKLS